MQSTIFPTIITYIHDVNLRQCVRTQVCVCVSSPTLCKKGPLQIFLTRIFHKFTRMAVRRSERRQLRRTGKKELRRKQNKQIKRT